MIFRLGRWGLLFAPTQEASAAGLLFERERLGVGGGRVEIRLKVLRLDSPARSELICERIGRTGITMGIRSDRLGLYDAGRDVPIRRLVERLVPVGLVLVVVGGSGLSRRLGRLRPFRTAPDRAKRFAFGPLDLGWVRTSAPLEIQMLANRVVQQTHRYKAYSAVDTFAVCGCPRIVLFLPWRLAS